MFETYESRQRDETTVFVKRERILSFKPDTPCIIVSDLVTSSSDFSPSTFLTESELDEVLSNPNIIEWRSENVCMLHPKLKHVPLGLHPDPDRLAFCRKNADMLKAIPKIDAVYTNFSVYTNPAERECFLNDRKQLSFEDYMLEMAKHKYVMCPMGRGIDTHRFWEAQLCGCIPIVRCPKEFLPTYINSGGLFVCLPGACFVSLGDCYKMFMQRRESVFYANCDVPVHHQIYAN